MAFTPIDEQTWERREYLEGPVRVEYEITEPCRRLIPILDELGNWSLTVQTVRA